MRVWAAVVAGAMAGTAGPASAQAAEPTRLAPVEVVGSVPASAIPAQTVDTAAQARARLHQRAGGTAVVEAESYRDRRVSTLTDALGYAPGVFVQPRFGAEEARLSIRGSGIQRTFHGRGLELLQDGVPLNLADGGFDFQAVEPLAAQYIEVYRGANALEYGAASLGGAINFVSPTGYDAPALTVRAETGGFGYRRTQLAGAGVHGALDGYVSASSMTQDGFRDHARQENYRLFGNVGVRFSSGLEGRLYLTHVDTRSQLPGSLTRAQFRRRPSGAAPGNVALDQRRDFLLTRVAGRVAWQPAPGHALHLTTWYADKALDHPIFQVLRQDTQDYGADLRWRADGALAGRATALVAGLTASAGDVDDDRFANLAGNAGARTNTSDQRAFNLKAYGEYQLHIGDGHVLSLGAQALRARRRSDDRFITAGVDQSFARTYRGLSPKVGWRWDFQPGTQFYANVSDSLEPPSFGELAGGPGITLVDDQRARTAEAGVRITTGALWLDAAAYRARVRNELLSLTDGAGNPLGTVNANRTRHQGVELGLGWQAADTLGLRLNYLWNDFRFRDDPVFGHNRLAGVPPHQLRAELRWQLRPWLYVAPQVEWTPQDYAVDHANTFDAPDYAVFGLRAGGDAGRGLIWFAEVRNLTDRDYVATTGVVADARGQDGAYFLPGDGRALYFGAQYRLP